LKIIYDFFNGIIILNVTLCVRSGQQLDVIEVTQNEDLQKFKLRVVLETANRLLGYTGRLHNSKWSVEGKQSIQSNQSLIDGV
jgi:hypothetical protein